jgi:hypothetical protein
MAEGRRQPGEKGNSMALNEEATIDELAQQMEVTLEIDYEKKDLKAQRELTKQSLYDGSKKLKHTVPKGKRV